MPRRCRCLRPSRLLWLLLCCCAFTSLIVFLVEVPLAGGLRYDFAERDDHRSAGANDHHKQHRILVIADPQLTDVLSYDFMRVFPPLRHLVQLLSDYYMVRSYRAVRGELDRACRRHNAASSPSPSAPSAPSCRPAEVFLGDLTESSRYVSDAIFYQNLRRWERIFGGDGHSGTAHVRAQSPTRLAVAGNHDIGLAQSYLPESNLRRWVRTFSPQRGLNYVHRVGARFDIVVVNTCYAEITYAQHAESPLMRQMHQDMWDFVERRKRTTASSTRKKTILLSHVPFGDRADRSCGKYTPLRERPLPINVFGKGYLTTLDPRTTQRILNGIQPDMVISGDDHMPCEYTRQGGVKDYIVGTFSFLQGTQWPTFAILHLDDSTGEMELRMHSLPNQWYLYIGYAALILVMTVLVEMGSRCAVSHGRGHSRRPSETIGSDLKGSRRVDEEHEFLARIDDTYEQSKRSGYIHTAGDQVLVMRAQESSDFESRGIAMAENALRKSDTLQSGTSRCPPLLPSVTALSSTFVMSYGMCMLYWFYYPL